MNTHAIKQDITMHYNVVWYKVVQSGTLHSIQLQMCRPSRNLQHMPMQNSITLELLLP